MTLTGDRFSRRTRVLADHLPATDGDVLFAALNRRLIAHGDTAWTVEIQGIHRDGASWWVQIAPPLGEPRGLLLHVTSGATLEEAISALERWRPDPAAAAPQVIEC